MMKKSHMIAAILLVLVAGTYLLNGGSMHHLTIQESGGPHLDVQAPASCQVGELVRLDASTSEVGGIIWRIEPPTPDFEIVDDGKRAMFSARSPGTYTVIVAAATDNVPSLSVLHVKAISPESDLSGLVMLWMRTVKYDDPVAKREMSIQVKGVFANLIEADIPVDKMLEATASANVKTLGADLDKWEGFLQELSDFLDRKSERGELETAEAYREIWQEIADAIEATYK